MRDHNRSPISQPVGLFLAYRGFNGDHVLSRKIIAYLVLWLVGADGIEPPTAGV
jgi:hypothetical protein